MRNWKVKYFVQTFDSKALLEIGDRLSALANKETIKQEDMEFIVNDIGRFLVTLQKYLFAKKEFQMPERQKIKQTKKQKNKKKSLV